MVEVRPASSEISDDLDGRVGQLRGQLGPVGCWRGTRASPTTTTTLSGGREQGNVGDIRLWIDTAGLRGVRVSVRDLATHLGMSTRQAHRRIRTVDEVVAAELNAVTPGEFRQLAR